MNALDGGIPVTSFDFHSHNVAYRSIQAKAGTPDEEQYDDSEEDPQDLEDELPLDPPDGSGGGPCIDPPDNVELGGDEDTPSW